MKDNITMVIKGTINMITANRPTYVVGMINAHYVQIGQNVLSTSQVLNQILRKLESIRAHVLTFICKFNMTNNNKTYELI